MTCASRRRAATDIGGPFLASWAALAASRVEEMLINARLEGPPLASRSGYAR